MVGCIPPWSAERWRPWSHAFQSASAPSCPGDFWWEGKGSGEAATGSDSNRNFPFQIQWKQRIWMKTMRTSMVFEYCHPLKNTISQPVYLSEWKNTRLFLPYLFAFFCLGKSMCTINCLHFSKLVYGLQGLKQLRILSWTLGLHWKHSFF